MGGVDWAGLPYVAAYLGVRDPQALMDALLVIKTHQPAGRDGKPGAG